LKSVVSDFYKIEELIAAKEQLLKDVNRLDPPVTLPHISTRREGEARSARVVDDIFTLLTIVDENLRMKSLPNYVAESPDCMPATRLYDGDLAMLMVLFEKMNGRLSECGSSVAAMFSELLSLKEQVKVLSTNLPSTSAGGAVLLVRVFPPVININNPPHVHPWLHRWLFNRVTQLQIL